MANRGDELLQEAAKAFEDGRDPFSTSWLSEHEVTGQECFEMGQSIAAIIKGYLASPPGSQVAFIARGIFKEAGFDEAANNAMLYHHALDALRRASQE
jgi:hypothetical protein